MASIHQGANNMSETQSATVAPQQMAVNDLVKVLQALSIASDQRLAATAGMAAVISMLPGVERLNSALAGRIAASMVPQSPNNETVLKLAVANAIAIIRLAQALRTPPPQKDAPGVSAVTPPAAAGGNGKDTSATA
jgi:hypothetical protein